MRCTTVRLILCLRQHNMLFDQFLLLFYFRLILLLLEKHTQRTKGQSILRSALKLLTDFFIAIVLKNLTEPIGASFQRIEHPYTGRKRLEFNNRFSTDSVSFFIFTDDVHGRVVVGDVLHLPQRDGTVVVVLVDVVVDRLGEARVGRLRVSHIVQV